MARSTGVPITGSLSGRHHHCGFTRPSSLHPPRDGMNVVGFATPNPP
jgi:hypothetical protein